MAVGFDNISSAQLSAALNAEVERVANILNAEIQASTNRRGIVDIERLVSRVIAKRNVTQNEMVHNIISAASRAIGRYIEETQLRIQAEIMLRRKKEGRMPRDMQARMKPEEHGFFIDKANRIPSTIESAPQAIAADRKSLLAGEARGLRNIGAMSEEELDDLNNKIKLTWVTYGDNNVCPSCIARAGQTLTLDEWRDIGLPREGATYCKENCRCALVNSLVAAEYGDITRNINTSMKAARKAGETKTGLTISVPRDMNKKMTKTELAQFNEKYEKMPIEKRRAYRLDAAAVKQQQSKIVYKKPPKSAKFVNSTTKRETDKAILFTVQVSTHTGRRSIDVWVPKSIIDENGNIPMWFIQKKEREIQESGNRDFIGFNLTYDD